MDSGSSTKATALFPDDGEMARAMQAKHWGRTLLGPVGGWPAELRAAISICLNSHFPMAITWGAELVYLYNDAAIPIFGRKHPWALGERAADVWPEAWETLGPMLQSVLDRGKAVRHDNLLLVLVRNGFAEECYFTFSYSPILAANGTAAGVFVTVMETSDQVLGERRRSTLADLGGQLALRAETDNPLDLVRDALARNHHDLPLAALYLPDAQGQLALAFCTGLANPDCLPPEATQALADKAAGCLATAGTRICDEDWLSTLAGLCGAWPEPPRELLCMPVCQAGKRAGGVLLLAVNPRKALDVAGRGFYDSVAAYVAHAMATARSRQDLLAAHAELERRVAQRTLELREASGLLAAVFDRAPSGIVITDLEGNIVRSNAAYAQLTGCAAYELQGRPAGEVLEPADAARLRAGQERLLSGRCDWFEVELRWRLRDGRMLWVNNFVSVIDLAWRGERYFVAIVQDVTQRKRADAERLAAQRELRVLYERLQTVRDSERTALAREVHDQLGQILSAAKIDIKLLEDDLHRAAALPSAEYIIGELVHAGATLERGIVLVREIATRLRAPELDEQGLYAAIEWHAHDFERRTRIGCHLMLDPARPHPQHAAAAALLRIFQEAMTNVLRHAHAGKVWVSLERRGAALVLRVRDDGVGIARGRLRAGGSLGLQGMRERAELAGGKLLVGPLAARGTLVSAWVPLEQKEGAR